MTVADERGRRVDAATGILASVLLLAGFFIQSKPPEPNEPIGDITAYLATHRSDILTGDFLIALGGAVFIWWLGSLRSYLRAAEGGEGRLSAAAFLGGGVSIALVLAGASLQSGLVLNVVKQGDAGLVRLGFDFYNALITMGGVGVAALIAGASCSAARSGSLPPGVYWSGSVIAGLQIATLPGLFKEGGVFAAGGPIAAIAFLAAALWVILVSVVIIRRSGVPPVVRTDP